MNSIKVVRDNRTLTPPSYNRAMLVPTNDVHGHLCNYTNHEVNKQLFTAAFFLVSSHCGIWHASLYMGR